MSQLHDKEKTDRDDHSNSRKESRRSILAKMVGATGFVTGLRFLPTSWTQPLLRAEGLPAGLRAQMAPSSTSTTSVPIETTSIPVETTSVPVITTTAGPVITTTAGPVITTTEGPVITTTEGPVITTTEAPVRTTTVAPGTTSVPIETTGLPVTSTTSTTPPSFPVELVDFRAVASKGNVVLTWATASESNNAGFAIETTPAFGLLGSFGWKEIAFVDGHGNSNRRLEYRHVVKGLAPGRHRFRLRQTDLDGAFEYSSVVEVLVETPGTFYLSQVYPNPFSRTADFQLTVTRQQRVAIDIYNQLGQRVMSLHDGPLEAESQHAFRIEAGDLPNGVYVLRVKGENFADTRLITLVR